MGGVNRVNRHPRESGDLLGFGRALQDWFLIFQMFEKIPAFAGMTLLLTPALTRVTLLLTPLSRGLHLFLKPNLTELFVHSAFDQAFYNFWLGQS
jgi:hypothetical protein